MSDTARDYQIVDAATTDGMDELFEKPVKRPDDAPVAEDRSDNRSDNSPVTDIYWTPQEAASYFRVSVRTIRRRLAEGTLAGRKVIGSNGPEWQIDPVADSDNISVKSDRSDSRDNCSDKSPVNVTAHDTDAISDRLFDYLREKDDLLLSKEKDLQAASATIGYLRAQIEAQEQQLKLLTDSQYKAGWWTRFSTWFFRSSSQ